MPADVKFAFAFGRASMAPLHLLRQTLVQPAVELAPPRTADAAKAKAAHAKAAHAHDPPHI